MNSVIDLCKYQVNLLVNCKDKIQYRIIKASLETVIRKWCDQKDIVFVSKLALSESEKLGIDLFQMQWKHQPKFDEGRSTFHLEHKYAVGDMIRDMVNNPNLVEDILSEYQIGWILKSEDKLIQKTNRKDHDKVYEEAGIDLIYKV